MQSKLTLPVVLLSFVAVAVFAVNWVLDRQRVYDLTIATASKEGEYYAFGQALANAVSRHHPNIRLTVRETEGSLQNIALLNQNQAQLAIVQSDTPIQTPVQAVAYLFPEAFHLIAATNSGIQHVADLRGKRVALLPEGSGSYRLFWAISPHYGLTKTNFESIVLPADQAYEALRQGRVDALFRVIAAGNPSVGQLLETVPARLVSIDQAAALQLSLPYLEPAQIAKGTYNGSAPIPPADLPVVAVRAVLVSRTGVNADVIQAVTQTLFEFRNEIVAQYPRAATVRLPESGENLGLPLHPGAKAYYNNDQPSFFVAYAESLGLLLSIGALLTSSFWQLRSRVLMRQKNRADRYNIKILELIAQVETAQSLEQLEQIRQQLFEIFSNVVVDLDTDRITPESFQSFIFPCEVAISAIRHREIKLLNLSETLTSKNPLR
jgi:TRAP transporter TAXI family solute receptor